MESAYLVGSVLLVSIFSWTSSACMWKVCDQIRLPNTRERSLLEVYNCDYRAGGYTTSLSARRCPMPRDIRSLVHKQFQFRMTDTALTEFPEEICPFTNLTVVNLQRNRLKRFPNVSSSCLRGLRRLLLNSNRLEELDLTLVLRLKSLEELEVEENALKIITLSASPPADARLRILRVARSRLKVVDLSVLRITSLTTLDLSLNSIGRIENRLDWKWRMEAGQVGAMRRRKAVSGPLSDRYRFRLQVLLRGNIFTSGFRNHRLWGFDVGSPLRDRAAVLTTLLDLQRLFAFLSLDVAGSRVECDCHSADALDLLRKDLTAERRAQVGIRAMDVLINLKCQLPQTFRRRSLNDLKRADLFCEHRKPNCPDRCVCTEFLNGTRVLISCRAAALDKIPDRLPKPFQPKAVYELDLRDNKITGFHESPPAYAPLVTRIDLRGNRITGESPLSAIANFERMKRLDLRNNPIRHLSKEILNLTEYLSPNVLKLSSDQFTCNCSDFEIYNLQRIMKIFPDYYNFYCLLGNIRQRIQSYRRHVCVPEIVTNPNTNHTSIVYHIVPSNNRWLIIIVASVAGVIITTLLIATVVVLYRLWHRDRGSKRPAIRQDSAPSEPPPFARPPILGPLNSMPRSQRYGTNPYVECRTLGWGSSFGPAIEERVALVHPTVSVPSLPESSCDEDKTELRSRSGQRRGLLENPPNFARSHELFCAEENSRVSAPSPPPPPSPYPAVAGVRRLRTAQSLPRVPPPPPPREDSFLTRQFSHATVTLPWEFRAGAVIETDL